jgi:hypothetical protein
VLYGAHLCSVMAGAGFQPDAIETVARYRPEPTKARARGRSLK